MIYFINFSKFTYFSNQQIKNKQKINEKLKKIRIIQMVYFVYWSSFSLLYMNAANWPIASIH